MKISDSEMKIMNLIWEGGGPVTTAWLTQRLEGTGWKATTLLTFLSAWRRRAACGCGSPAGRTSTRPP